MKRILTYLFLMMVTNLVAQDIHFSQYEAAPHFKNPATVGAFRGSYRAVVNNKDQWGSVGVPYRTSAASIDFALPFRYNLMGIGLAAFQDNAGRGGLQTSSALLSVAYHFALGYDGINDLAFGANFGYTQRGLSSDNLTFPNQYNGDYFFDPSAANGDQLAALNMAYFNAGVGAHWFYTPDDMPHLFFGSSVQNLLFPPDGFMDQSIVRKLRIQIHGGSSFMLDKNLKLFGKFNFNKQGRTSATIVGVEIENYMVRTTIEKASVFGGVHYRLNDAVIVVGGADISNIRFAISYDVTVSTLAQAANYQGGAEFSLIYRGFFKSDRGYKCPKFDPTF